MVGGYGRSKRSCRSLEQLYFAGAWCKVLRRMFNVIGCAAMCIMLGSVYAFRVHSGNWMTFRFSPVKIHKLPQQLVRPKTPKKLPFSKD